MVGAIMDGSGRLGFWPVRSYKERFFWVSKLKGEQLEDLIFFNGSFFILTHQEGIFEFVLDPDSELQGLHLLPAQEHIFCPADPPPWTRAAPKQWWRGS